MRYEQIRNLNELASYLPLIKRLDDFMDDVIMQIKEINARIDCINANPGKKGPTPGVADLKKRVEMLENAVNRLGNRT